MCLMTFHTVFVNQKCVSSLGICACFLHPNVKSGHKCCIKIIFIARSTSAQQHTFFSSEGWDDREEAEKSTKANVAISGEMNASIWQFKANICGMAMCHWFIYLSCVVWSPSQKKASKILYTKDHRVIKVPLTFLHMLSSPILKSSQ